MISATTASAKPSGPARVPCPGPGAASFAASCSLFGLLPPLQQGFLPAIAQLALFRLAQPSARVGVDDQHPMTRSRAPARLAFKYYGGHNPHVLRRPGVLDGALNSLVAH
jgi:hypothetical protein